jgi:hypothetical protein
MSAMEVDAIDVRMPTGEQRTVPLRGLSDVVRGMISHAADFGLMVQFALTAIPTAGDADNRGDGILRHNSPAPAQSNAKRPRGKIDMIKLRRMLRRKSFRVAEAAKEFGVTQAAVRLRVAQLRATR